MATTAAATALAVLIPLGAMFARSLRTPDGYSLAAWTDMGETEIRPGVRLGLDPIEAMLNSLRAAGLATLLAVAIGGLAALAIHSAGRHGRLLDAGLMLPLGTSAVTIGFGMLITFDVDPIDWRASPLLVPIGHALIAVPFVVRTTLGVLAAIDPRLREAATTLGATPACVGGGDAAHAVASARRRCRAGRRDLTRRVRRHELSQPARHRDDATGDRAAAGTDRIGAAGAGVRARRDPCNRDRCARRARRTREGPCSTSVT
ncbi:MAG: hypothetical protein WKF58_02210 [Ilumatobacteraceae bacterium]